MKRSKAVRLKVLHLASFAGNIGDIANHAGARRMFAQHVDADFEFTDLEIREFYWKQRHFDDSFVDWANTFDLVIIGGGNYFELWVDSSETGTSIDISPARLRRLRVPTVFYALGVDTGQGYSERSVQRFGAFMATVLDRRDMFVCVRNDGSSKALKQVLGAATAGSVPVIPDGGFFVTDGVEDARQDVTKPSTIGINIAGDMLEKRFASEGGSDAFLDELAHCCAALLDADANRRLVLIPHIWRDIVLLAQLLPLIPDPYLRRRVRVATLDPTRAGLPDFVKTYQSCDLVLGMRFHANVCPIGMQIPTRALLSYPQVRLLYEELGCEERLIDVGQDRFRDALLRGCESDLADISLPRARNVERVSVVREQAATVLSDLNIWLQAVRD